MATHSATEEKKYPGTVVVEKRKYDFEHQSISLSPQLIYNFYNTESLKVYVGGGLRVNYSMYGDNTFYVTRYYDYGSDGNKTFYNTTSKNYLSLFEFWYSIPLKAGVVFNNAFELQASYSRSIKPGMSSHLKYSNMQVGIDYLFSKK